MLSRQTSVNLLLYSRASFSQKPSGQKLLVKNGLLDRTVRSHPSWGMLFL